MTVPRTDYERIAVAYDRDRKDRVYGPLGLIRERLDTGARGLTVLDVGCGPGRWLAAQTGHFAGEPVQWVGVDASLRMVQLAWSNAPLAQVMPGRAEALPFASRSFDIVVVMVAFHHVEDKARALDEMRRVLRPGGTVWISGLDPWRMRHWWVYEHFPETWTMDEERFWPAVRLKAEFEARGFSIRANESRTEEPWPLKVVLDQAKRRTVSNLAVLDDAAYTRDLRRLREEVEDNPDRVHRGESAFLDVFATLNGVSAPQGGEKR